MKISWKVVTIFLIISVLDLVTTSYGLSIGLVEGNPLITSAGRFLLQRYLIFTAVGVLMLLPYARYNRYVKTILTGMIILKSLSPLNNLALIFMYHF
ncbi:DUF5658 family protein [Thermococcus sp.]